MRETELGRFYGPPSGRFPLCSGLTEGQVVDVGGLKVTALQTPGHSDQHNCYLVDLAGRTGKAPLVISGDLIFAGSLGGGYYCCQRQMKHARRVLGILAEDTVIAPGHGPLTTAGHERRYNPFLP